MALITAGSKLARSLWPSSCPQLCKDKRDLDALTPEDVIPSTLEGLMAWAYVKKMYSADPSRRFKLAHATGSDKSDTVHQVTIRFQGFVLNSELRPLGSWRENVADAPRAKQHLTLHGGGHVEPMAAQVAIVNNVTDMVCRSLRYEQGRTSAGQRIHFQNLVFTKVTAGSKTKNLLKPSDDTTGKAKKMEKQWIVAERIAIGKQTPDGKIRACSGLMIRPGDFVDILGVAEIVTFNKPGGRNVRVNWNMKRVIQLKSAALQAPLTATEMDMPAQMVSRDDFGFDDETAEGWSMDIVE